jgi:4-hydroxybutyrate dehydrogenase
VRKLDCKRIIAIGGGSVIDIAKLLTLKPTGNCVEFFEKTVELVKEKELLIVPTTCGTGSEVTNISIANLTTKNTKMGLAVEQLFADKAVLVAELINGLPEYVFVTSSIDALVHAMESYLSPKASAFSEIFSVAAIKQLLQNFNFFLANGRKVSIPTIASSTLLASTYGGIAFGNAGCGAVHAMAYPLGGVHHVPHGEANARFLTGVFLRYLSKQPVGKIEALSKIMAEAMELAAGQDPWKALQAMVDALLPKKALREYGMTEAEVEGFADSVIEKQQRLLANNYVPLSRDEIRDIFKNLW